MKSTQLPGLYILNHPIKGRCIHTAHTIKKNNLIEICPLIVLKKKDKKKLDATKLHDYYFNWGRKRKKVAIALGYGSLYNHAQNPNAQFEIDLSNQVLRIISKNKIKAGQEITISYTDNNYKDVTLWFDPV